jgi:aminoglycoside phosphotransferase family enzyme
VIEPLSSLEATVAFLLQAKSYPEPTQNVEAVETHMSWVFLTGRFAYKLKKPAKTSFLDFSTAEVRKHFCEEEVRLNRRLAPRVYLGTVAITRENGAMALGGHGTVIDWLVKMHRLSRDRMLDRAIGNHSFTDDDIDRLAARLAAFYRSAPSVLLRPSDYRRRIEADISADFDALRNAGNLFKRDDVDRIHSAQLAYLLDGSQLLEQRAEERRIVEAHGDLRPEHVFLGADPQVIDCLEFNVEFRTLDPLDELAFFAMECEMLRAPAIGTTVFDRYYKEAGDRPSPHLIDFYKCYRAVLRAKLSIWHLREPKVRDPERWPKQARRYLDLAGTYADRLRFP